MRVFQKKGYRTKDYPTFIWNSFYSNNINTRIDISTLFVSKPISSLYQSSEKLKWVQFLIYLSVIIIIIIIIML
jgi:uncharacterized membrane-anchored protein